VTKQIRLQVIVSVTVDGDVSRAGVEVRASMREIQ
jgi:hypothetical protein